MEPGLFLPVTEDGAKSPTLWSDPLVVKYKAQFETMIANSQNGALFGFTGGHVFPSIGAISARISVGHLAESGDRRPGARRRRCRRPEGDGGRDEVSAS